MYRYMYKNSDQILEILDSQLCDHCFTDAPSHTFCWWHISDITDEIDKSSEPWDEETCWWVVDTMCNKCHAFYGMNQRYPISICTDCGHIQEE